VHVDFGWGRLRIVIAIINDWIYKKESLKKIIIVRYSFDESTAL